MREPVLVGVARRWVGVRPLVRALVSLQLVALTWGAVVHAATLAAAVTGPLAVLDAAVPAWMAVYWVSLTALDPLAAVLLALRRRVGLGLSAGVLVSDVLVNGYAIHVLGGGGPWAWAGHLVVTALAVTVVLTWPVVSPWLLRWRSPLVPLLPRT